MIKLILPGEPVAQARPRVCKNFTYDPQAKQKTAARFQLLDRLQPYNHLLFPYPEDHPIEIELNFFMTTKWQENNLPTWGILENISKKDLDNLAKFYLDVMNKIVYVDDKQVNKLTLKKYFDNDPRTEIYIMPSKPKVSEKVKEVLSMVPREYFVKFCQDINLIAENFIDENLFRENADYTKAAYLLCEFAEKNAAYLTKVNKKFKGFAKVLEKELEKT